MVPTVIQINHRDFTPQNRRLKMNGLKKKKKVWILNKKKRVITDMVNFFCKEMLFNISGRSLLPWESFQGRLGYTLFSGNGDMT